MTIFKKIIPSKKLVIEEVVTFLYLKRRGGVIGSAANLNSITIYKTKSNAPTANKDMITAEPHEYFEPKKKKKK